ncbi:hypothetical protein GZH53_19085 [Flavihumibacter sp. R14]|nr:hypothetical protein [Flavihumibacter soli]
MSIVLNNIGKDNTRFTIFENDQVLTADQLNDLFNYLDVQTRLTRTKAIGVGIICGLEIGVSDNAVVVSRGAAVTTDGDLLHFDNNRIFDQYELFEDGNAHYPYFKQEGGQVIPIFELKDSSAAGTLPGKDLSGFEEATGKEFKDFIGILYLEDYNNDPDICTGTDCDNKGIEAAKELKVLLVHRENMRFLLQSMPAMNSSYFALDDISIPRVRIENTINTPGGLNEAFSKVLGVKDEIKTKLGTAYKVCKTIVEDDFDDVDPTVDWSSLLDQHFNVSSTTDTQYVYDFARDISSAYNELRETLFTGNVICCPEPGIFAKHILLGLVNTVSIKSIPESPISPTRIESRPGILSLRAISLFNFKPVFNIGLFKSRFTRKNDIEYRHPFYESPVLNSKEENTLQTRFCFMRINSMIKNFKIPASQGPQTIDNLKITPSFSEDKPLGQRSIPFYYRFNRELPVNLYWSYKANVRKKEDAILSYSSAMYSSRPATINPLDFNILPNDFFRIEGHVGLEHAIAETAINNLIMRHNLPFNVLCVQVEDNISTIPRKPWHFPEIVLQDAIVKHRFFDSLNQAEVVNDSLKAQTASDPEGQDIRLTMENFSNAKARVMNHQSMALPGFDVDGFKKEVQSMISATAEVKVRTNRYDFAQTAVPHDFVINTDIVNKADLLSDLVRQREEKKRQDLILGNFMKQNPGAEHAGGVMRGGTFILVYMSSDKRVVADLMLPYYVADKEVVLNPPVPKPLPLPPPLPVPGSEDFPASPFGKIFKKRPIYRDEIETMKGQNEEKFGNFAKKLEQSEKLFEQVVKYTPQREATPRVDPDFRVGGQDFKDDLSKYRERLEELEKLAADDATRPEKEAALLEEAEKLTNKLNDPAVAADADKAIVVKSVLADIHSGISQVKGAELSAKVTDLNNLTVTINKGLVRNR